MSINKYNDNNRGRGKVDNSTVVLTEGQITAFSTVENFVEYVDNYGITMTYPQPKQTPKGKLVVVPNSVHMSFQVHSTKSTFYPQVIHIAGLPGGTR